MENGSTLFLPTVKWRLRHPSSCRVIFQHAMMRAHNWSNVCPVSDAVVSYYTVYVQYSTVATYCTVNVTRENEAPRFETGVVGVLDHVAVQKDRSGCAGRDSHNNDENRVQRLRLTLITCGSF